MEIQIKNLQKVKRLKTTLLKQTILASLKALKLTDKRLECSVMLCDDDFIAELNKTTRGKDKPTDVLSFPQYEPKELKKALSDPTVQAIPLGDIVISVQTAIRQAKEHDVSLDDELRRLLVHGLLHLLGYDHERSSYQARLMRQKERVLLEDKRFLMLLC